MSLITPSRPRNWLAAWIGGLGALAIAAGWHLGLNTGDLNDALGNVHAYVGRFFPPDYSSIRYYSRFLFESVAMAAWGTVLAFLLAAFSTLTGSRNFTPHPIFYRVTRLILSGCRVLPDYIMAIIFVSAFGPGPLAGVVTITIGCFGQLGKLWNDALERVDSGLLDGIDAAGGRGFQRLRFGGWPATARDTWGYTLFAFDRALREAAVIGVVGAGGIGMELSLSLRLFDYRRAAVVIGMIVAVILVNELVSSQIRKHLV